MYQSPNQPQGGWNPNAPPTSQPGQPQSWSPAPPNGYQAQQQQQRPNNPNQAIQQQGPPAMQTLQPNHPDQYRATLPPVQQMYPPPYQQAPQMQYPPTQPAPRQRTAIACRYCRRRKIRCSGFDQSEDGRCTNCQRFSQECVFTPVSAQTQAFVPAHTVWRGQNPPPNTQLYGAYGQPLPQHGSRDQYPPGQQQAGQPGQYPPPPQGYQQQPMYQQPPQGQIQPQSVEAGRKRANDEPHTPTLPPPNPAAQMHGYPDPSVGASPASSTASYHSVQYPPQYPPQSNYTYPQPQAHRVSSQSMYSVETSRASSSPHSLGMPISEGRTPPPPTSAANAQRSGVKINELVGGQTKQQEERTSADSKKDSADGAAMATEKKEEGRRNGNMKDVGVQVELIGGVKEQAS